MQILTVLHTALLATAVAGNTINTTTLFSRNTVITNLGKIQGVAQIFDGKRVTAFLGVPYAGPPINKRRFTEPVMIRPWAGVLDATKPSPACYLTMDATFPNFTGAEMWNPQNGITEDCLKMNIWVPEKHNGSVMVWIFGGGFFSGSPSLDLYNGTALAVLKETIVVNINYRLGAFGFLYLGEMSSAPGNMGLLDQQVALRWVHENIGSFGGDPSKVTLFGESAGSASVTAHLAAPYSYPYFSRIIGNSGSIMNSWATKTPEAMFNLSMKLAERVNCTKKGFDEDAVHLCLTSLPASVIQEAADNVTYETSLPMTFGFVPISADRNFFKGDVFDRLRDGKIKKNVDVILGTVKDEGTYWLPYYLSEYGFSFNHTLPANDSKNEALITRTQYRKSIQTFMPYFEGSPLVENALLYRYQNFSNNATMDQKLRDGVGQFIGDYFFTCSVIDFADVISRIIKGPVYMYYLTMRSTANPWPKWMGVMHGYEIEYEFGQPFLRPELYDKDYLETEQRFSKYVMRLWMNFANTGVPGKSWPKYDVNGRKTLVLGEKSTNRTRDIIFDVDGPNCRLLEEAKAHAGHGFTLKKYIERKLKKQKT
ncbi:hypothetical protein RB195_007783 [Necator americanus]|uniref:Carboxylic ester hydrolase n=1 Tax=Necator americanus TaxID=51031 RepID=A0ABR1C0H6_NECAM